MQQTKATKSVHFSSQNSSHAISSHNPSSSLTKYRTLEIEDETQTPSKLIISEKNMKLIQDCSKMKLSKQLNRLSKDGVIFLRSSNKEDRSGAIRLRNIMLKLLTKYQFVEKVPNPLYDTNKSLEENDWCPPNSIKPIKKSLKAVFVGSVGKNEPKWRSFWEWSESDHDKNTNDDNIDDMPASIAPESQNVLLNTPQIKQIHNHASNKEEVTFDELTEADKITIYKWAIQQQYTLDIKNRIFSLFKSYSSCNKHLEWNISVEDPLWFRMQSIGSMLHSDLPYILGHTNLLNKLSGHKLLLSGIDMQSKEKLIGKKSDLLKQKLPFSKNKCHPRTRKCPLCSYKPVLNDDGSIIIDDYDDDFSDNDIDMDDNDELYHNFCSSCCDLRYGLYTVWTALDYYDNPFDSGSLLFIIGSHTKYNGYYKSSLNNLSVPSSYSSKSIIDKQHLKWGYVNNIKPGDQFIFNIKTLHASPKSKDGFLRARIDMRVSIKPSNKRYIRELKDANIINNTSSKSKNLGLSQLLLSQPVITKICDLNEPQMSPEFNVPSVKFNNKLNLSLDDITTQSLDDNNNNKLKRSKSVGDININMNIDKEETKISIISEKQKHDKLSTMDININNNKNDKNDDNDNNNDNNVKITSIQDLPTQANDTPDLIQNDVDKQRNKILTPPMDNDNNNNDNDDDDNTNNNDNNNNMSDPQIISAKTNIIQNKQNQNTQKISYVQQTSQKYNNNNNNSNNNSNNNNNNNSGASTVPETELNQYNKQQYQRQLVPQSPIKNMSHMQPFNNNRRKRSYSNNNILEPPNKRQKISNNNNNNNNVNNSKLFMSDEDLYSTICNMRSKVNKKFNELENMSSEALDLMEVAHQRYLYVKQQLKNETERADHYQIKVETCGKKLMENQNLLFKMFESEL